MRKPITAPLIEEKKESKMNFEVEPYIAWQFIKRCESDRLLKEAVSTKKNISALIYDSFAWRFGYKDTRGNLRTNRKQNLIIEVSGKPGTGKSTTGEFLAETVTSNNGQEFSHEDISFTFQDTLKRLRDVVKEKLGFTTKELKSPDIKITDKDLLKLKGITLIKDETKRGQYGVGGRQEEDALKEISDVFRKAQMCLILIAPRFYNYDATHYRFEAWGVDHLHKLGKAIVFDTETGVPRGHIITRMSEKSEIWDEYDPTKNKFIIDTILGQKRSREANYWDLAEKFRSSDVWAEAKTNEQKQAVIRYNLGDGIANTQVEAIMQIAILLDRMEKSGLSRENILV